MFYKFTKIVTTLFYRIFFRTKVYGTENIPQDTGVLLCCNHQSYHDCVIMATFAPRVVRYMAKKELFSIWGLSVIIKWLYAFPIDRDGKDLSSNLSALKNTIKILKNGDAVGIFAEGRRVKGEEASAKSGTVLLALRSNVPVVPIAISSNFKFFGKIVVKYGEPIYFEELKGKKLTSETLAEGTKIIMDKIQSLKVNID